MAKLCLEGSDSVVFGVKSSRVKILLDRILRLKYFYWSIYFKNVRCSVASDVASSIDNS